MVVGGAIIPVSQGYLADRFGYQHSFLLVLACYAYILFYALNGHRPASTARPQITQLPDVAGTRREAL
jgi:FHS family L-fucose permease-like MFS transporter